MKTLLRLFALLLATMGIFFAGISTASPVYADITIGETNSNNLNIGNYASEGEHVKKNTKLKIFGTDPEFIKVSRGGER